MLGLLPKEKLFLESRPRQYKNTLLQAIVKCSNSARAVLAETTSKRLAFCLAQKGSESSNSVQRGAVEKASTGEREQRDSLREKQSQRDETREEKEVRMQGLEPWAYGLKVRCSTN
jgi:hypothetical protein